MRLFNPLIVISLLLGARTALAFQFSPMVAEFNPDGEGSTQSFSLENTRNHRVAIQVEAKTREISADGKETRGPTKDFLIFPNQLALEAGERRNIRVTWRGNKNPPGELPFRLVATELPVDFQPDKKSKQGVQVNFLIQYVASIYIKPANVQSRVVVEAVERRPDGKAEFRIKNKGNAHQLLNSAKLRVRRPKATDDSGKTWEVVEKNPLEGENLLPGIERKYVFRLPPDAPQSGALEGEIQLAN